MAELTLDKNKTAVIIANFYGGGLDNAPHARDRKVVENVVSLQAAARREGLLILYTATVFREGYPEISPRSLEFGPRKASGEPVVSDPLSRIHPDIAPRPGEPVVEKNRMNGFFRTDMDMILGANGIQTLALMGFTTSGVILSTVRYAADADYGLVVVEDCCADLEPDVHAFLMERIFPQQATVTSAEAVIKAITR